MNLANILRLFTLSTTLVDFCQTATDGFFSKAKVMSNFLAKHKTQVLDGVTSPSLCAAETDELGAEFFMLEETTATCTVVLFSKTMTAFWSSAKGGNFTEVYAGWRFRVPGEKINIFHPWTLFICFLDNHPNCGYIFLGRKTYLTLISYQNRTQEIQTERD